MTTSTDPAAPHGRDANGVPLAPYGLNVDGSPRKSNRGARAGQRKNPTAGRKSATPQMVGSNLSDIERKGMLTEIADMLLVGPLASLSQVPVVVSRIGKRQADALAGDAFILSQYMPGIADGLILLSKTKPATLAWLDKAEQNAPYLVLASAGFAAAKALVENHINPNPQVAIAGRSLAAMRLAQMAAAVNAQASAIAEESRAAAENARIFGDESTQDFTTEQFEAAAYNRVSQEG